MRSRPLLTRVALFGAGSVLSSLCYAITIRAGLGLGPLYVLQDGLSRQLHVTIGHAVMLTGVMLIALACTLRWRPGLGTLALPFVGGITLDAMLPHVPTIDGWPAQVVAVVVATWMMGLGGALMIRAAIGYSAWDGIMVGLHNRYRWSIAPVRLAMEAFVFLLGWRLGGTVGVGTVITGVLIGTAMQFWLRVIGSTAREGAAGTTLAGAPSR